MGTFDDQTKLRISIHSHNSKISDGDYMRIIERTQINDYRLAVAKVSFLRAYASRYVLARNLSDSCMLVNDTDRSHSNNQAICVSVLQKPNERTQTDRPIRVFYQNRMPSESAVIAERKKHDWMYDVEKLSQNFNDLFDRYIQTAFFDPDSFLQEMDVLDSNNRGGLLSIFYEIRGLLDDGARFDTSAWEKDGAREPYRRGHKNPHFLCKYYSDTRVDKNKHDIRRGCLSFSSPDSFNDPFDCNCQFSNGDNASDKFRVLCLTRRYDNILMWSHYASEHKGYCFRYEFNDIYETIRKSNIYDGNNNPLPVPLSGLCIWGNTRYTSIRPAQRTVHGQFTWSDIKHYTDAAFSKFDDWSYEKEIRFVIVSDDSIPSWLTITAPRVKVFEGCENTTGVGGYRLSKDPNSYALV